MEKVAMIQGIAAAFAQPNVDTDAIIRVERLMSHGPGELGPYCFESLRYRPDGSESPDFVLNQPRARGASILLAGENFGCGSSREAAVWSLMDIGIRCIIASSFGDIFRSNSTQNGLLAIALPAAEVQQLMSDLAQAARPQMSVDLVSERMVSATGRGIAFAIDPDQRSTLLQGLDEIAATASYEAAVATFQVQDRNRRPWIYCSSRRTPRLLLLGGEGLGRDITAQVKRIVTWFAEHRGVKLQLHEGSFGQADDQAVCSKIREEIRAADAILLGSRTASAQANAPTHVPVHGDWLRICKELDLFGRLQPVRWSQRSQGMSAAQAETIAGADLLIVREQVGGLYFGTPRGIDQLTEGGQRAGNAMVYTTVEIERIARVAFELARGRRGHVCAVDMANVLEVGTLWHDVVHSLRDAEYPDVQLQHISVEEAVSQLLRAPRQFDVILTEDLCGGILSECAAALAGSGMRASASLGTPDSEGHRRALYEPGHGCAREAEHWDVANPLGAIGSFGLCLQFTFRLPQEARLLQRAIDAVMDAMDARGSVQEIAAPGTQPLSAAATTARIITELNRMSPP